VPARASAVDRHFLTPLTGAPKRGRFAVFDLESKDGPTQAPGFTRIFLAGLYDGSTYRPFFDQSEMPEIDWKYRSFCPGGSVDRFMRSALTDAYRGTSFYAHNGGAFDFLHILPWLVREKVHRDLQISLVPLGGSGLLAIDVWKTNKKWQRWRFVDSVRLIPMALDQAIKSFGKGARKLHGQDGARILNRAGEPFTIAEPEDDPGWIPYNEADCRALFEVLERVHDLVEMLGGEIGLTAPSTAVKTFRRSYLKEPIARDVDTHEFVRRGYFGGRTEWIFDEGHYLYDFDVNSSYPFQMTLDMPAGNAVEWTMGEPPKHWKNSRIGFCEVVVEVPDDIGLPPLPVRADSRYFPDGSGVEGKLIFPTGLLAGVWEWGELENAVAHGCRIIEWKKSIWYDAKPILREFVETLYKYRNQAKCFNCAGSLDGELYCHRCAAPGYDKGLDAFAKLLMNALYGKFAQNPVRTKFYWITDPDMPNGCKPLVDDDPDCQVWIKEEEGDAPFIMPQISARITAQARVLLYKFAMEAKRRVLRQCRRCKSKITCSGYVSIETRRFKLDGVVYGGSGPHGEDESLHNGKGRIEAHSVSCPCGGALETRHGEVYYMDTDSLMTDVMLPTGARLGELKDEIPRYGGFLEGRFYGPKLYRLSVEPEYLALELAVRRRLLEKDPKFLGDLKDELDSRAFDERGAEPVKSKGAEDVRGKGKPFERIKAKGITRENRTRENLETLYQGALDRLAWVANPDNRHADGRLKPKPKELEQAGTIYERRLEKIGTLARLVKRDKKGRIIKKKTEDGRLHPVSAAFERGPLIRTIPKRLHLEGAKRIHQGDGTTKPYHIDMVKGVVRREDWS
jgi:hypothetical protein